VARRAILRKTGDADVQDLLDALEAAEAQVEALERQNTILFDSHDEEYRKYEEQIAAAEARAEKAIAVVLNLQRRSHGTDCNDHTECRAAREWLAPRQSSQAGQERAPLGSLIRKYERTDISKSDPRRRPWCVAQPCGGEHETVEDHVEWQGAKVACTYPNCTRHPDRTRGRPVMTTLAGFVRWRMYLIEQFLVFDMWDRDYWCWLGRRLR
jgi:hypothetical protein